MVVNPPREGQALCGVRGESAGLSGWRGPGDGVCLCSEHLGGSRESPQGPVHLLGMHSEHIVISERI